MFAFATVCSVFALAEEKPSAKSILSVSIRSSKSSYNIKEKIVLQIQLENGGNESIIVPRVWGWGFGRTDVGVFDSNGKQVVTSFLADEIPPPPHEKDFIELKANEFFGILLSEDATDFVNVPGTYDFVVAYTSPFSERDIRKVTPALQAPRWGWEKGTTVSNKLRLDISK